MLVASNRHLFLAEQNGFNYLTPPTV